MVGVASALVVAGAGAGLVLASPSGPGEGVAEGVYRVALGFGPDIAVVIVHPAVSASPSPVRRARRHRAFRGRVLCDS